MKKINIAVDGTAGSGKSSVMSVVAKKFGMDFIDTGLMYRAFTKFCLDKQVDFKNEEQVNGLLSKFKCKFTDSGEIYINEDNYTSFMEVYTVAENVKHIAANPVVRAHMVKLQKDMAKDKCKVMVGRDITTVVLPDAELKIYFDSSPEARALRRFTQNEVKGIIPNEYQDILRQIKERDESDKNRSTGALKVAPDAWYLDTSIYSLDEVVELVSNVVKSIV